MQYPIERNASHDHIEPIPLDSFYRALPSRATWTPSEVYKAMSSYNKDVVIESLYKHNCVINNRLVVFTKHPVKLNR